jgi:tetratricopeptide (TPR) repeat protein
MPDSEDAQARLVSWKEIASYLGRSERTLKRWEEERGLPVHRVPGGARGSVYAFPAELDLWLRSESNELKLSDASAESPSVEDRADASGEMIPRAAATASNLSNPTNTAASSDPPTSRIWLIALPALVLVVASFVFVYIKDIRGAEANGLSRLPSLLFARRSPGNETDSTNPEKAQARDLYLRGRYEWNKRTPESLDRAVVLFTQALDHDPSFALAYAGLADSYNLQREFSDMPEKEAYARAIVAARKAIELDESLAEAHRSLAFALTNGEWDFAAGQREYLKAIALNPNDPVTHLWYANSYQGFESWDVLLREMDLAQKLDPTSSAILADKGNMLFNAGRTEEAIELLRQVERNDPQFIAPHRYLTRVFFYTRDYPGFLEEADKTVALSKDTVLRAHIAAAKAGFARDGERGLLQDLYAAQEASLALREIQPTVVALTCLQLGKKDEAFGLAEQDIRAHSGYASLLVAHPAFVAYKNDPAYQNLIRQFNPPSRPLLQ